MNNVLPAHVEGFGSVEGIARAKGEIYSGVNPVGTAVINLDEPYAEAWRNRSVAFRTLTFALESEQADFRTADIQQDELGRSRFELVGPDGSVAVQLPLSGKHNIANALAAAACAYGAGADMDQIAAGLQKWPRWLAAYHCVRVLVEPKLLMIAITQILAR